MALSPALNTLRTASTLLVAAIAGLAVWLFMPVVLGSSFDGGSGNNAALPPSLRVDGVVQSSSDGNSVSQIIVPLAVRGDEGIDLGGAFKLRAETSLSESAAAAVPATYSIEWQGGNGDSILDPGEAAIMTVNLPVPSAVHPENPLRLVLKPASGGNLVIEDVLN